jgi:hypothetical protein
VYQDSPSIHIKMSRSLYRHLRSRREGVWEKDQEERDGQRLSSRGDSKELKINRIYVDIWWWRTAWEGRGKNGKAEPVLVLK